MTTASTGEPLKEINCSVKCKTYYPRERNSNPLMKCAFTIRPCDASSKDSNFKTPSPTENNTYTGILPATLLYSQKPGKNTVSLVGDWLNVHTAPSCRDCSAAKRDSQTPAWSHGQGKQRHRAMHTACDNFRLKDNVVRRGIYKKMKKVHIDFSKVNIININ